MSREASKLHQEQQNAAQKHQHQQGWSQQHARHETKPLLFGRHKMFYLLAAVMPEPRHWPQVCRIKITFELLLTICFVFTTTNSMKCLETVFHWIRMFVWLNPTLRMKPNPTLKNEDNLQRVTSHMSCLIELSIVRSEMVIIRDNMPPCTLT